jgi:hypothetical protein
MAHVQVFQMSQYTICLPCANLIPPVEFAAKFSVTLSTSTVEHDVSWLMFQLTPFEVRNGNLSNSFFLKV